MQGLETILYVGGGIAGLMTAGTLYLDGKATKLELNGQEVEAELLRLVGKMLIPIMLGGVVVYMLMTFPLNIFMY